MIIIVAFVRSANNLFVTDCDPIASVNVGALDWEEADVMVQNPTCVRRRK